MTTKVAVFGDSTMWGQGLLPEHQFARLALQRIVGPNEAIEILPGLGEEPGRGFPRSGAKINAKVDDGNDVKILLPGGGLTSSPPGDRANFARTFRSLFANDAQLRAFLAGASGEGVAASLFGENPATFPTVAAQVVLAGGPHPDVDFVVVSGGANDVDFEKVLDPEGPSQAEINRAIDSAFGRPLADLLTAVRRQFPQAVVIVTGYYPVISAASNRALLKQLFEFFSKKPEWQISFNDVVRSFPLLRDVLAAIGLSKDVGALVESAIRRTATAAALAHHRTRATIAELPPGVRLPGMFYAHPAFRPEHALFAGKQPLVHSGYRFPGHGGLSVADEMLDRRQRRIPRRQLLGDYQELLDRALPLLLPTGGDAGELRSRLTAFRDAHPDLPSELLRFSQAPDLSVVGAARLIVLLRSEIGRIETAVIASFLHPNPAGARRYADQIVLAHDRHRTFRLRREVGRMVPPGAPVRLRKVFDRPNLRLPRRATALAAVMHVESVALRIGRFPKLPLQVGSNAIITLGSDVRIGGSVTFGRESGSVVFAFDTPREIHLSEITMLAITNLSVPNEVELHLNGREFARWTRAEGVVTGGGIVPETIRFAF
jgi:lysophospholipase L1-like esterase